METTYIYSLIDPTNNQVRYVGKSSEPKRRLKSHLLEKHNFKKLKWLRSLKSQNIIPDLFIIDKVNIDEWEFWERHYISLFRSFGFDLVNLNEGGAGGHEDNINMESIRQKQRESKLNALKKEDNFIIKNLKKAQESLSINGRTKKPEDIANWLKSRRSNGKPWHTQETINKYADKLRGRKRDPEAVAKMAKTNSIPIVQLTKDGEFVREWESTKAAKEALGFKGHSMGEVLKQKVGRKTMFGFRWMLKSEWEKIK